ncbi:MAG: hypothetical protein CMJ27_12250 [Phycisphaerae bacterium]|nr:hypothetical protein [Phycisphaerae bacterium]
MHVEITMISLVLAVQVYQMSPRMMISPKLSHSAGRSGPLVFAPSVLNAVTESPVPRSIASTHSSFSGVGPS